MTTTYKTAFLMAACILCTPALYAQNTINPRVEVQRNYEGQIMATGKPRLLHIIPDSISQFNIMMDYSIFEKPYRDLYSFTPLPFVKLLPATAAKHPWVLIRLGLLYPLSPEGNLFIQAPLDKQSALQFTAEHRSFWEQLPLAYQDRKAVADQTGNKAALRYALRGDKGNFEIGGAYRRNQYTYYGIAPLLPSSFNPDRLADRSFMRDSLSHIYNFYKADMSLSSPKTTKNGAIWDIKLAWSMIEDQAKLWKIAKVPAQRENLIGIEVNAGGRFMEQHTAGVMVTGAYSNDIAGVELDRGVISFNPYYMFRTERGSIEAGIIASHALNYRESDTQKGNKLFLYPKVMASYQLIPKYLEAYADLRGEGRLNSYQSLMAENPWLSYDLDLRSSHAPWIIQAGFKGKIVERLGFHMYGQYSMTKNQHYYVNTSYAPYVSDDPSVVIYLNNLFGLSYATEEKLTAAAALSWDSKPFCLNLKGAYHHYTLSTGTPAWHKPNLELSLNASYQWRERIIATASAAYRGGVSAPALPSLGVEGSLYSGTNQIDGFADLGLMLEYRFASRFGIYLEGKNLLNSKQQYYQLYTEPGIRAGGGITIRF
ncbi:MAG: TonB-dependent receptor [Bacteroidales bacterium]|nr:TonB-dependent receptor [Bacteroidales bacterium]